MTGIMLNCAVFCRCIMTGHGPWHSPTQPAYIDKDAACVWHKCLHIEPESQRLYWKVKTAREHFNCISIHSGLQKYADEKRTKKHEADADILAPHLFRALRYLPARVKGSSSLKSARIIPP